MAGVTYQELVELYGNKTAYDLLRVVERSVNKRDNITPLDRDERLKRALTIMNNNVAWLEHNAY